MLERIGRYEIKLQIGRGAMGVVYEAWDTRIERRVALKTLRTDRIEASQRPDLLARFLREAKAVGRLSHPHIVTIHDSGEWEGTPYLVMEYISGHELAHDLERRARFPLEDVVRIMAQMLGALGHAHGQGVVHRDLKPANMFLLEDGSLKVVDFGIARIDDSDFTILTSDGAVLGTPAYMSPEQVDALPVDHRSDLFSAGTILCELLVGERPFTGESVHTVKQKVRNQEPLRPSEANPTLSAAWDRVISRALAKKPSARYESALQFSEAIKAAHQAERAHAAEERPAATQMPAARRGPVIAATIFVVAAVIGAVLYTRESAEDQAAKAEAARVAAETREREEAGKRAKAEAHAREETEKRSTLEAEAARRDAESKTQAERENKSRAEQEAKKKAGDTAKALALKKEENERRETVARAKAEEQARREAEAKAQAEIEARRATEDRSRAEAAKSLAAKEAQAAATKQSGTSSRSQVWTTLHVAIAKGDEALAVKLIEEGADIEAKDPGAGASPIHCAVMRANVRVADA